MKVVEWKCGARYAASVATNPLHTNNLLTLSASQGSRGAKGDSGPPGDDGDKGDPGNRGGLGPPGNDGAPVSDIHV